VFIIQGHETQQLLYMPMKMRDTTCKVLLSLAYSQTGLPHKAFSSHICIPLWFSLLATNARKAI